MKSKDTTIVILIFSLIIYLCILSCNKKELNPLLISEYDLNTQISISIKDFGAIPNDNLDDSEAIQKAINFAVNNKEVSKVYCPPGIYYLEKGVTILKSSSNTKYDYVTLTISGPIQTYDSNQKIGSVAVFKLLNPSFGIALQSARNCVIENIVFQGSADYVTSIKNIIEWDSEDWGINANARINRYSPSCAIVIDPFHKRVPESDRYEGFEGYYKNTSKSGSSMVLIRGCTFNQHYIALAVNPSNGVNNGDNIRVENSHVKWCHTFWSSGQTQSRANSVENVYALFINTFISGRQIGSRKGTPPFVDNLNLAGFTKQLLDLDSGFTGFGMRQSYLEGVWSLGIALVNGVHFEQCQIKFATYEELEYLPPVHLYTQKQCTFSGCSLEYFANCTNRTPFFIRSNSLLLSGCHIEGGVVLPEGYTNAGGENIHNLSFQNTYIKCKGKYAGKPFYEKPPINLRNELILGGQKLASIDGSIFQNLSSTYNIIGLGLGDLNFDGNQYFITTKNPEKFKKGESIITHGEVSLKIFNRPDLRVQGNLGYVSNIEEDKIYLNKIAKGISLGRQSIRGIEYPIFIPYVWGSIIKESTKIFNINTISDTYFPKVGTRIYSNCLDDGTYITGIDLAKNEMSINIPAISDCDNFLIHNANYSQEIRFKNNVNRSLAMIKGAMVIDGEKLINVVKTAGIKTSKDFKPKWERQNE